MHRQWCVCRQWHVRSGEDAADPWSGYRRRRQEEKLHMGLLDLLLSAPPSSWPGWWNCFCVFVLFAVENGPQVCTTQRCLFLREERPSLASRRKSSARCSLSEHEWLSSWCEFLRKTPCVSSVSLQTDTRRTRMCTDLWRLSVRTSRHPASCPHRSLGMY